MTSPSTESKPLRERLLPQTSIRFIMLVVGVSALVMYIYREAFASDAFWAKIAALLIQTVGGCFIAYTALFVIASLFTATTTPIWQVIEGSPASGPHSGKDDSASDGSNRDGDHGPSDGGT